MSKKGATWTLEEAKKKALAMAVAGNTQLMDELNKAISRVSRPVVAPAGQNKGNIAKSPKKREMSGTEREFHAILKERFPDSDIMWEKYIFQLAPGLRYIPDFAVHRPSGLLVFYEVKSKFLFRGAHKSATAATLTKPKVAAEMFRHVFIIAQKIDGKWFEKTLPGKIDA